MCVYACVYRADDVQVIEGRRGVRVECDLTGTALARSNNSLPRMNRHHLLYTTHMCTCANYVRAIYSCLLCWSVCVCA